MCAQSCLPLCIPRDCSPPGSSVLRLLQARILEWVAMSSSRGSSEPRESDPCLWHLLYWQVNSLPLAPPGKPSNLILEGAGRGSEDLSLCLPLCPHLLLPALGWSGKPVFTPLPCMYHWDLSNPKLFGPGTRLLISLFSEEIKRKCKSYFSTKWVKMFRCQKLNTNSLFSPCSNTPFTA